MKQLLGLAQAEIAPPPMEAIIYGLSLSLLNADSTEVFLGMFLMVFLMALYTFSRRQQNLPKHQ